MMFDARPNKAKGINELKEKTRQDNQDIAGQKNAQEEQAAATAAAYKENDLIGSKDADMLAQYGKKNYQPAAQQAKQNMSDSVGKKAGVTEDVFDLIAKEYEASLLREKENEEKHWEGFGSFFAKPDSITTQNQANKFSLGSGSKTAEEVLWNRSDAMARIAGGSEGIKLIEKLKGEKEYERARRNKEEKIFSPNDTNYISEEEYFRLLQLNEKTVEKEIEKLEKELYNYGGIVAAVSAGTLGKAKTGIPVQQNPELREEISKLERDIALSKEVKKQQEYFNIQNSSKCMEQGSIGYTKYQDYMKNMDKEDHSLFEEMVLGSWNNPDITNPVGAYQYMVNTHKDIVEENQPNEKWSTAEKNTFGYYWINGDYEKAAEYARGINNKIWGKEKQKTIEAINYQAMKNPLTRGLGDMASVAVYPLEGLNFIDKMGQMQGQGYVVENKIPFTDEITDYYRGKRYDQLDDKYGKGVGDAYNVGMETMDSVYAMTAGSLIGGKPMSVIASAVTDYGSTATELYKEAIARGATPKQALQYSGYAASADTALGILADKSFINTLGSQKGGNFIKDSLLQGTKYAAKEGTYLLTEKELDETINREHSKFNFAVSQYMAQGYSKEEAERMAFEDIRATVIYDIITEAAKGTITGWEEKILENID